MRRVALLVAVVLLLATVAAQAQRPRRFFESYDRVRDGCWWTLTPADELRGREEPRKRGPFAYVSDGYRRRIGNPSVLCWQRVTG